MLTGCKANYFSIYVYIAKLNRQFIRSTLEIAAQHIHIQKWFRQYKNHRRKRARHSPCQLFSCHDGVFAMALKMPANNILSL